LRAADRASPTSLTGPFLLCEASIMTDALARSAPFQRPIDSPSLDEFWRFEGPEQHGVRAKAILASHPEMRRLIGRNPWTGLICASIVVFQVAVAAGVSRLGGQAWIFALAIAWTIGAFANHCLYVIIHDATHDLVFRRRYWNKLVMILADLPNLAPGAIAFRAYHLHHHSYLGVEGRDADLPSLWERRAFGGSFLGKSIWLFLFPIMQAQRTMQVGASNLRDPWFALNLAANAAFAGAIYMTLGSTAVLYLLSSFWFSIGLHPLGARWIQEHFTLDPRQGTTSYYGRVNVLALNIGYHNEHHDFPSVPWNLLPTVKQTAPEFYDGLSSHTSWSRLLWNFLSDRRYSLASRVTRG
jgi:sphingolipid delta-4 desaturase